MVQNSGYAESNDLRGLWEDPGSRREIFPSSSTCKDALCLLAWVGECFNSRSAAKNIRNFSVSPMAVAFLHLAEKASPYPRSYSRSRMPGRTILNHCPKGGFLDQPCFTRDVRCEVTMKDVMHAVKYTLSKSPSAPMAGRNVIEPRDVKNPGPQRYKQPQILTNSFHPIYPGVPSKIFADAARGSKIPQPSPGPGDYENVNPSVNRVSSPSYPMGRKRHTRCLSCSPRPECATYDVTNIARSGKVWRGPSWSIIGRHPIRTGGVNLGLSRKDAVSLEPVRMPGRSIVDTCGRNFTIIPTWSFSKAKRFLC